MRKKGLTKSISPAPFSCFSVRSTSTLFSNIQFSEGYSDFLVSLFIISSRGHGEALQDQDLRHGNGGRDP